jgi:hypothetical protein
MLHSQSQRVTRSDGATAEGSGRGDVALSAATIADAGGDASWWALRFARTEAEDDFVRFTRVTNHSPVTVAVALSIFGFTLLGIAMSRMQEGYAATSFSVLRTIAESVSMLLTAGAMIALRITQPAQNQASQSALTHARLVEAVPVVGLVLLITCHELTYPWVSVERCHGEPAGHDSHDGHMQCYLRQRDGTDFAFSVAAVFFMPRLAPWLLSTAGVAITARVASIMLVALLPAIGATHPFTAMDFTVQVLLFVTFIVAFTVVAIGNENNARAHFLSVVKHQRARRQIEGHAAVVCATLQSALPAQLLETALLPGFESMAHCSPRAACVIANIHSFAEWSTGLLIHDVVDVLHQLLTNFDLGVVDFPDIVRAMTYGDSYVAVCGLVTDVDDVLTSANVFATWQLETAKSIAATWERPFNIRVSVATGALVGGIVGGTAKRYIVAGEALVLAGQGILACGPNVIIVAVADPDAQATPTAVTMRRVASRADVRHPSGESGAKNSRPETEGATTDPETNHRYDFSKLWLSFHHEAVQAAFERSTEGSTTVTSTAAVWMLMVFGVFLLVIVVENVLGNATDNALMMALLGVAVLLSGIQFVHRQARFDLPLPVTAPLLFLALASAMVGIRYSASQWIPPSILRVCAGVAFIDLLPRAPWLLQTAIFGVAVVLPNIVMSVTGLGAASRGLAADVAFSIALLVFVTLQRYRLSHATCVRFVAASVAADAVSDAADGAAYQEAALAGLVPAHVLPFAARGAHSDDVNEPEFLEFCDQLSVLQLELSPLPTAAAQTALVGDAFAPIVQSWDLLAELVVRSDRGVLELVQATGDTFIVAGPYDRGTDEGYRAAAVAIVDLLRELNMRLRGARWRTTHAFTAVATAGSACGALLGASKLTYRMFGAAIRESSALLEAAPRMPGVGRNVAFATEAFRRLHGWGPVPKIRAKHEARANMSLAVSRNQSPSVSAVDSDVLQGDIAFRGKLLWRVKGVGATSVCSIVL